MKDDIVLQLTDQSRVDLSHLTIQQEGEEYTIGDPLIQRFIRVPEPATFVLALAKGNITIEEIREHIYLNKGVEVDVLDFMKALQSSNLVYRIDDQVIGEPRVQPGPSWSTRLGRAVFHPFLVWMYGLLAIFDIVFFLMNNDSFPHYRDIFVFKAIGLNSLYVSIVACTLVAIHECAHYLSASREGVSSKIRLNMRYIFLTAETDMTGLWGQPRRKRYLPYLAGMAWDSSILAVMIFLQSFAAQGTYLHGTAKLIALLLVFGIVSQFLFFLRTDMYFVIGNLTNSADLEKSGKTFLKRIWKRKDTALSDEWNRLPVTEKKAGKVFGVFYAIGICCITFLFVKFSIPGLLTSLSIAFHEVVEHTASQPIFWDGAIILGLFVVRLFFNAIGAKNAIKEYIKKKKTRKKLTATS